MIDKEIEDGKLSRGFWSSFEMHKEMMEQMKKGDLRSIQAGEQSKNKINIKKEEIKG